jgi:hypothetical protein
MDADLPLDLGRPLAARQTNGQAGLPSYTHQPCPRDYLGNEERGQLPVRTRCHRAQPVCPTQRSQQYLRGSVGAHQDTIRHQHTACKYPSKHPFRAPFSHPRTSTNKSQYYVYQCDMVKGVEDLRTPLSEIIELDIKIRGTLSGFMMPAFVIDLPGGGGKRLVSTKDSYDPISGLATYRAPGLAGEKGTRTYKYYDPKPVAVEDLVALRQQKAQALETGQTLEELARQRLFIPMPSPWEVPTFGINHPPVSQPAPVINHPPVIQPAPAINHRPVSEAATPMWPQHSHHGYDGAQLAASG